MTIVKNISPDELKNLINKGNISLIDIREVDEHKTGYIENSINMPMSKFDIKTVEKIESENIVIYCLSGMRCEKILGQLSQIENKNIFKLNGGINAWKSINGAIIRDGSAFSIMQQVLMIAGSLVLLGSILSLSLNINWVFLPMFIGAGLLFAGITGWCGMAKILSFMPWNK
jgi:rhodanese-related sulfurtransferase